MIQEIMNNIARERPVGSAINSAILSYLENQLADMGYEIQKLPFFCTVWETKTSGLKMEERTIEINASPFSEPCDVTGTLAFATTFEELSWMECEDQILILGGELASSALMPKNYPFTIQTSIEL